MARVYIIGGWQYVKKGDWYRSIDCPYLGISRYMFKNVPAARGFYMRHPHLRKRNVFYHLDKVNEPVTHFNMVVEQ